MQDRKAYLKKIKDSVDVRHFRLQLILITCVFVIGDLVLLLATLFDCLLEMHFSSLNIYLFLGGVALSLIITTLFAVTPATNILHLTSKAENYHFYDVQLHEPYSYSGRCMGFIVEFQNENGDTIRINTNEVFMLRSILEPSVDEYMHHTAEIAYDAIGDRIVVTKVYEVQEDTTL